MTRRIPPAVALFILILLCPLPLQAQEVSVPGPLAEGISLFKEGQYTQAIVSFRKIIFDPQTSAAKAEAYFWLAKTYMAVNNLADAERNLELFLAGYPNHPYRPEALYQKGRLLFMQGDPESAIQVLQGFLEQYPSSELSANALYWSGEALYSLGNFTEAARLFQEVVQDYPTSFKVEASRYRLSIIEFKKRENELLKLLKWSHEESLKAAEEFQRREKAYEQALAAYQRRLADLRPGSAPQGEADLAKEVEQVKSENEALKSRILVLEQQLSSGGGPQPAAPTIEEKLRLLELQRKALALKELLLERRERQTGNK